MTSNEPEDTFDQFSLKLMQRLAGGCCAAHAGASAAPPAAPPAFRPPPRLWELGEQFTCPVVGTCLSIEEVRQLARKHDLIEAQASDYEAHTLVVGHCKSRNPLAEDVQRALDRKHALWRARFAKAKSEEAVDAIWQEALDRGEAAGAFWALLTCRAVNERLRRRAYEDIHMLSHQVGAGVRVDLKRTAALQARVVELEAQLERTRARADRAVADNTRNVGLLWQQVAEARERADELDGLRRRVERLESGAEFEALRRRLDEFTRQARELEALRERAAGFEAKLAQAEAQRRRLEQALADAEDEREALERFAADILGRVSCPNEPASCLNFGGRRLLCVGGRANLVAQYRALVERAGGVFEWHDGGREEAVSRLPDLLARQDAVICPADCVSHSAYYQLKRYCKLSGTPCLMLKGSGLGSFAEGLRRLAEGRVQIGAEQPD